MSELKPASIYQLKVWLQGISPMVWRRLLVRSDSTIADLHYTIQIAMGWSDVHLNRFHIHGQDFGVYHDGGICFSDNPEKVLLSAFGFRTRERFFYEYDFGDEWLHEVRIEKRLPLDPKLTYSVCIDGKHAAPGLAKNSFPLSMDARGSGPHCRDRQHPLASELMAVTLESGMTRRLILK
jgi:hypothetical protein